MYKSIDMSKKTSKKSTRIILKHFLFCLCAFCFSASPVWDKFGNPPGHGTGCFPGAQEGTGSRGWCVLELFQQGYPTLGADGCNSSLLHPSGLPVSPQLPSPPRSHQEEARAEKLQFPPCVLGRGQHSPGAAATAWSSSTVAFSLLEEGNASALPSWTPASRALPHSEHFCCL